MNTETMSVHPSTTYGNWLMTPQRLSFFGGPVCASYCEIRTNYFYGRESIFLANPYCHGPLTCTITDAETTQVSFSLNIPMSVKLWDIFSAGLTGGFTKQWNDAHAEAKSINLNEGRCGYFTFLPILKGSW